MQQKINNYNTKKKNYNGNKNTIKYNTISMFHRPFFNSIIDKTPTHALFTQHYISLAC